VRGGVLLSRLSCRSVLDYFEFLILSSDCVFISIFSERKPVTESTECPSSFERGRWLND
jgi:hypothetical protein